MKYHMKKKNLITIILTKEIQEKNLKKIMNIIKKENK